MATTPNFNWSTPDNTGLVKNGALDIRTLGNSIDASMAELKGGTTGQVLSKTSNTDMDFTWVAQDDSNAIQNAIVDAKGDLIAATANDTPARLAVGTNGQVLQADSTAATGLKWATVSGGDVVQIAQQVLASNTNVVTFSSIPSTYRNLRLVYQCRGSAAQINGQLMLRFNGDTGSNYDQQYVQGNASTAGSEEIFGQTIIRVAAIPQASATANVPGSGTIVIPNYVGTTFNKDLSCTSGYKYGTSTANMFSRIVYGAWRNTAAITSLSLQEGQFGGDLITGSVFTLYGEK
jgi:hypothetical protein